jgi:hypothetical protein
MEPTGDRVRAWLVFKVENRADALRKIDPFLKMGGNDYVVIRGDLVDEKSGYDLVVPVDARDQTTLDDIKGTLLSDLHALSVLVLQVMADDSLRSLPWPPHAAHSYITEAELRELPDDAYPKFGRQWPASPGANPWG